MDTYGKRQPWTIQRTCSSPHFFPLLLPRFQSKEFKETGGREGKKNKHKKAPLATREWKRRHTHGRSSILFLTCHALVPVSGAFLAISPDPETSVSDLEIVPVVWSVMRQCVIGWWLALVRARNERIDMTNDFYHSSFFFSSSWKELICEAGAVNINLRGSV